MADFVAREKIQDVISDIFKDEDSAVKGACIEIWSRVKEIPAAEVRPVVLCQHCINWGDTSRASDRGKENWRFCPMVETETCADWFCADGEKREGE